MKSILYVGATLMISASIYGFADYKQTSRKKEFKNMYTEEKAKELPLVITEEKKDITPVVTKEVIVNNPETRITKRKAKVLKEKEETIVAVKPIEEDLFTKKETVQIKEPPFEITSIKENPVINKTKKKKKINTKFFSRAPLREDYEEELPVKKESRKVNKL